MFTWLIITLWCNFPEQSLGVLRVRAVSLWLVQTAQTTKNITALGPAPGFPFPTPPPTSPIALRLSEMYSGWFFSAVFILPFSLNHRSLLFPVLEIRKYWGGGLNLRSILMNTETPYLNAGLLFPFYLCLLKCSHNNVCVAELSISMHLTYIDVYLLHRVEPEHLVSKVHFWMTDNIWECCCNHRKQCSPSAPCPAAPMSWS